ncbi:MAG TPA: hypothetical protein DCS91_08310 [Microcoleaceae bacterium UBA11344]|jgi:hypothetical protein|nr:hypothetical protein [Microcoleaceae cyanobacterium UBA11344]
MSQLIIANIAAPFVLSKTGNIFVFLSIIPVEMLVIWVCFKLSKITISFSRLFIAVLVANTATSILGIPLIFNFSIAPTPVVAEFVLPISFILSLWIEYTIYKSFFFKQIPRGKILASFFSNLASYTIFWFFLASFDFANSGFFTANSARVNRELKFVTSSYIHVQTDFYNNKNRFASNWEELGQSATNFPQDQFHQLDIQGDATKASLTARSKREDIKSYRLTIFVKDKGKFIQGICETDKPSRTPPEMPQLVNGKFQCPPGSSDKSDEFRLRNL